MEEEPGAPPPPSVALDAEDRGHRTRDPTLLSLPGALVVEGLADAALQDGECLPGPADPSALRLLEGSPWAMLEEEGRTPYVTPCPLAAPPCGGGERGPRRGVRRRQHPLPLQWRACGA